MAQQSIDPSGPRIVVNPAVFRDSRDALCVAMNEAYRVLMEDWAYDPVAEPTERQREFFADTAYAEDERMLRRTILARICTFDTSVEDPTQEQVEEAVDFLDEVMESGTPQNEREQSLVRRTRDVLAAAADAGTRGEGTPQDTTQPPRHPTQSSEGRVEPRERIRGQPTEGQPVPGTI